MKKNDFMRTTLLNFLFVLILPVLLSFIAHTSIIVLIMYILAYSLVEAGLDFRYYNKSSLLEESLIKLYLITIAFNFAIIFGVALIIEYFLFTVGIFTTLILCSLWILSMSSIECHIDNYIQKKG